jgi:hypothetical protein
VKRRELLKPVLGAAVLSLVSRSFASFGPAETTQPSAQEKSGMSESHTRKPEIAMLIYPGLNFLDLTGPHAVLAQLGPRLEKVRELARKMNVQ